MAKNSGTRKQRSHSSSTKKNGQWHPLDTEDNYQQDKKQKKPTIIPRTISQESYLLDMQDDKVNIVFGVGPAGTGKAQPLTSKVLTPNGWVNMGDIAIGDMVVGHNGTCNQVSGVFPQGKKTIYKLTTLDGRVTRCCGEHLWQLNTGEVVNTLSIIDKLNSGGVVSLPSYNPFNFDTSSHTEYEIVNAILALQANEPLPYDMLNCSNHVRRTVIAMLLSYGKVEYTPAPEGVYSHESPMVAQALKYLIQSDGWYGKILDDGSLWFDWRVDYPFDTKVYSVVEDGYEDAQCIMIDSEDHLYVTDDFIVTHNTMLAVETAIKGLQDGKYDSIVVTRPNVEVDDRSIGFLPGTLHDKMAPWMMPIFDVFAKYYSHKEIANMVDTNIIRVVPIAFFRGMTFKDSFVIVDESQGLSKSAMKAVLTRIGEGSKMVLTGDTAQSDIGANNGLSDFIERHNPNNSRIKVTMFKNHDIQRHPVVSDILRLYGDE